MPGNVLVSACLLGLATRYDGDHNRCDNLLNYVRRNGLTAIPICPEQLAGLPTPRPKVWFSEGDGQTILDKRGAMVDETGNDMQLPFLRGAEMSLEIAKINQCSTAILKQRSPSCGTKTVHRNGKIEAGQGVTAALFERHGIELFSEDDFEDE